MLSVSWVLLVCKSQVETVCKMSYLLVLLTELNSPQASRAVYLCRWRSSQFLTRCSLLLALSPAGNGHIKNDVTQRLGKNNTGHLRNHKSDLFQGVHLGGEVGGFEHSQQRV